MNKNVNYCVGPLLTVSSATGTTLTKTKRLNLYPQAIAEAMEGFGVATAADLYQIPFIEIRTISNMVGQRRRDLWKIEEAIKNIEVVSRLLTEVL